MSCSTPKNPISAISAAFPTNIITHASHNIIADTVDDVIDTFGIEKDCHSSYAIETSTIHQHLQSTIDGKIVLETINSGSYVNNLYGEYTPRPSITNNNLPTLPLSNERINNSISSEKLISEGFELVQYLSKNSYTLDIYGNGNDHLNESIRVFVDIAESNIDDSTRLINAVERLRMFKDHLES
jgi:hypothetical protein